jgi:hypothetical protein
MFLVTGAGKAEKVRAILGNAQSSHPDTCPRSAAEWERSAAQSKDLPAGQVRPRQGQLIWLLDRAAASGLTW